MAFAVHETMRQVCQEMQINPVIVDVTDDMTEEEQEMALFEGFLREGKSVEEAQRKAKELLKLSADVFSRPPFKSP